MRICALSAGPTGDREAGGDANTRSECAENRSETFDPSAQLTRPITLPTLRKVEAKLGRSHDKPFICMARPERLELPTPRFEAWCSIQLSYGRTSGSLPR